MKNGKPEQGDIIKVNFNPSLGHEQQGFRPAIIISNPLVSEFSNVWVCCPISHTDRNYPYYLSLPNNCLTDGKILIDQVKSLDLNNRDFKYIETIDESFKKKISIISKTLFDI
ncbi:type II toxin-antitoxin system PemK/MazF family toxin [Companilactobacillus kimchiensis]|uniref:PemK-like protein n=1 Tax=Companilactobacillus kimchiensis TaxID=993692 RepID=A0A0R2LPN8_9LACO|nr:type II toxin-antitoxin system PemK/MazF family toxin [Companilactobacillus kimchiensis]KRO00314.1 hypothetical protein IV57_GL001416 [Companilactobacillus kimchiensis]